MVLTGTISCSSQDELDVIMLELKFVRNAKVNANGLTIHVDYEPADTESDFEAERNVALLVDIITATPIHGFSLATKRG